jgi:hypothetical protein
VLNKINLTSTIIIVLAFVIGMALGEASIYVGALYICLSLVSAVLFNSQCKKTKVLEEKKNWITYTCPLITKKPYFQAFKNTST